MKNAPKTGAEQCDQGLCGPWWTANITTPFMTVTVPREVSNLAINFSYGALDHALPLPPPTNPGVTSTPLIYDLLELA